MDKCTTRNPDPNAQYHDMSVSHIEYDRTGVVRVKIHCLNCDRRVTVSTHAVIEDA